MAFMLSLAWLDHAGDPILFFNEAATGGTEGDTVMKAIFSVVGLAAFLMACSGGAANMNVNHASTGALPAPAAEAPALAVGENGAMPAWNGPTTPGANELRMGSVGAMPAYSTPATASQTSVTSAPITAN